MCVCVCMGLLICEMCTNVSKRIFPLCFYYGFVNVTLVGFDENKCVLSSIVVSSVVLFNKRIWVVLGVNKSVRFVAILLIILN